MTWIERIRNALTPGRAETATVSAPRATKAGRPGPPSASPAAKHYSPYPVAGDDDEPRDSWYAPADGDKDRFAGRSGAMPPLHLIPYQDGLRLCEDSTGLLVSPNDRRLPGIGIFVVNVRGETYYKAACKAGDFSPGSSVRLRREPENPYDPNAVAITADTDDAPVIGYVNKQKARTMTRLIDSGTVLEAVSLRGKRAGFTTDQVAILAADPAMLAHLLKPRPASLPRPAFLGRA